ncbi:MAG: hypothetical protein FJW09_03115 [Actinobacteria bacterium]|nr:hypothetical protein [Actinomycetota bacterium]
MNRSPLVLVAIALATIGGLTACSNEDSGPDTTAPVVGMPDPTLPSEVNAVAYVVGAVAGIGNAEVRMQLPANVPAVDDDVYVLDVWVKSGALEPFAIRPEMFRVYTLDGKSYTPEAVGDIARFGEATLNTGETYSGLLAVRIPTDSEPAMFLADLTDLGERFFAAAFSVDPDFVPETPES